MEEEIIFSESSNSNSDNNFNEKLIDCVSSRPLLYNKTLKEFKNKFKKAKNWEEISEQLGKSGTVKILNSVSFFYNKMCFLI